MIHIAKESERLYVSSMGKEFRVLAISDSVEQANLYMERNNRAALIACFGAFNIIADKYEPRQAYRRAEDIEVNP